MKNHIGLAFSSEQIYYAYFRSDADAFILEKVGTIPYHNKYNEKTFFNSENAGRTADLINDYFSSQNITLEDLSFSIESNLTLLKRVTFPANLDEPGKTEHINWDLAETLILPLDQYVYFRSPNKYAFTGFEEELVVAIQKKIIAFFRQIVQLLDAHLVTLGVHQLAAELLVKNALENQIENLIILVKIAANHTESTFLWNGTYFTSHYDFMSHDTGLSAYIELIKSKISYIESLFEHYKQPNILVDRILFYGDNIEDSFLEKIQKNMSIPVDRINTMQNLTVSETLQNTQIADEGNSQFVECIGIALDV